MIVTKVSIRTDFSSCNFCNKGVIRKNGLGLDYPYDHVYSFIRDGGSGLMPCICKDCLDELYQKVKTYDETEAQETVS